MVQQIAAVASFVNNGAEFYAMCDTATEVRRLQTVLGELGYPQPPRPYVKSVGEPGVMNTGTIMFEE
jgi:hypothetical protein